MLNKQIQGHGYRTDWWLSEVEHREGEMRKGDQMVQIPSFKMNVMGL